MTTDRSAAPVAGSEFCAVLSNAFDGSASGELSGNALRVLTSSFSIGQTTDQLPSHRGQLGEEMGAVVSGGFRIDAADESYELMAGEGIIIPAGLSRVWTCLTPAGALYRVIASEASE